MAKEQYELERKEKQQQPIRYKDFILSATKTARRNLIGMVLSFSVNGKEKDYWQDINGKSLEFTKNEFSEIMKLLVERDKILYKEEANKSIKLI